MTYIPGNYNHFEVGGAKSKLLYMVSWKGSRQPESIMKHILSKKFVASHELTISLEIRASSNINYILESLSEGGGGGGGGSYQLCKFHCSRA